MTQTKKAEVSAESMSLVMMEMLAEATDGYIAQEDLEARILEKLGHAFTAADRRKMLIGRQRTPRPKWKNNLDWAKSLATKRGLIAVRNGVIVLVAKTLAHRNAIYWAGAKRRRTSMRKKCDQCGSYQRLAADKCVECGSIFPESTPKRFITPK